MKFLRGRYVCSIFVVEYALKSNSKQYNKLQKTFYD